MTSRAIMALAVVATCFLVLGARLLESPTAAAAVVGILSLVVGTALAALAVAAAWRPVPQGEPVGEPTVVREPQAPPRATTVTR